MIWWAVVRRALVVVMVSGCGAFSRRRFVAIDTEGDLQGDDGHDGDSTAEERGEISVDAPGADAAGHDHEGDQGGHGDVNHEHLVGVAEDGSEDELDEEHGEEGEGLDAVGGGSVAALRFAARRGAESSAGGGDDEGHHGRKTTWAKARRG